MAAHRAIACAALFLALIAGVAADCADNNGSTLCLCNATLTAWENNLCYLNTSLTLPGGAMQSNGTIILMNNSFLDGNGTSLTNLVGGAYFFDQNLSVDPTNSDITIRNLTLLNTNNIRAVRLWFRNISLYLINVSFDVGGDTVFIRETFNNIYLNDSYLRSRLSRTVLGGVSGFDLITYNSEIRSQGSAGFEVGSGDAFVYNLTCRIDTAVNPDCIEQTSGAAIISGGVYNNERLNLQQQQPYNGVGYYIEDLTGLGTLIITPRTNDPTYIINSEISNLSSLNRCLNCTIYGNNLTEAYFGTLYNLTWHYQDGQINNKFVLLDSTGEVTFIRGMSSAYFSSPNAGSAASLKDDFDFSNDYLYLRPGGIFDSSARVSWYKGEEDYVLYHNGGYCSPAVCVGLVETSNYFYFNASAPGNYTLFMSVGWSVFDETADGLINNVFGSSLVFALFLVFSVLGLLIALRISPLLAFLFVTPLFVGTVVAGFFGGAGYVKALIILILSVIWGSVLWNIIEK